jgi:putative long chain acyl-CoA synthase
MKPERNEKGAFDWRRAIDNAIKIMTRKGSLGAPYRADFVVVFEDHRVSLRRYGPGRGDPGDGQRITSGRPLLLVPPLMVTSEIYDISPDLSAVAKLVGEGADVWLADFGAPEAKAGGLSRTLDDHVLGISDCIDYIARTVGEAVHLIGYSQGGMFCYQAAAYRFSRFSQASQAATNDKAGQAPTATHIASVIAFGAPVDIRRNLPLPVHDTLVERLIGGLRRIIDRPLAALEALPGTLSARGFKLLAPLGELRQLAMVLGRLDDEEALAKILPKRRFLGGEGFIAWPGPALRKFIDEFVVENRMKRGGFVIDGRSVALADIEAPILCVLGLTDDLAQPDAVRAIRRAAERAEVFVVELVAGHFGLVVGSLAMNVSWPLVLDWARWLDAGAAPGARPPALGATSGVDVEAPANAGSNVTRGAFGDSAERVWEALGGVSVRMVTAWDRTRWRLPRMLELLRVQPDSRLSPARLLKRRARAIPERVCFLWRGRAYTYADANRRVDELTRALFAWGVRSGDEVAVAVSDHPDVFSVVLGLNRLGAVAVFGDPATGRVVCDAVSLDKVGRDGAGGAAIAVVGDGGAGARGEVENLDELARKTEPEDVAGFGELRLDSGLASDPLMRVAGPDVGMVAVSNGAWFTGAIEAAMRCELQPSDTVFGALPLSSTRAFVEVFGGALVGGARLGLATLDGATPETLRAEVTRVGATVVFTDAVFADVVGSVGTVRRVFSDQG